MHLFLVSLLVSVFKTTTTVSAQSSSATWQYPSADGLVVNSIDTLVLQWASNYNEAWMQIFCNNNGAEILGQSASPDIFAIYANS
jgi:hypothetical protein